MYIIVGQICESTSTLLSSVRDCSSSEHWVGSAGHPAAAAHSLLGARPVDQVHEAHPPPLHPRLQLLPVSERVGELTEPHAQGAQLVRGEGGGGGQRAEGLWGSGSWATVAMGGNS